MGQTGQVGQAGEVGQVGQLGQLGQVGQVFLFTMAPIIFGHSNGTTRSNLYMHLTG